MQTTKLKRYKVTFKGHHVFVNAGDADGAFAMARVKFLKIMREAGVVHGELGDLKTFKETAGAKVDTRY